MSHTTDTGQITISITGVNSKKGKLQIALFNSSEGFVNKPFKTAALDLASTNELKTVFSQLPPGEYSVAAYHDENDNGKLDKNLVGAPTEDYGFSNDDRTGMRLSAPSFDDTKFSVTDGNQDITVNVR